MTRCGLTSSSLVRITRQEAACQPRAASAPIEQAEAEKKRRWCSKGGLFLGNHTGRLSNDMPYSRPIGSTFHVGAQERPIPTMAGGWCGSDIVHMAE
ncbi:hypothetical protein VTI28DRAFT_1328 [Corynascus sepedonium]